MRNVLPAALTVMATIAAGPASSAGDMADLILHHGIVHTMDPAHPSAEAVAVRADRILAAGPSAEVLRLQGPATRMVDLQGRTVVPGLTDAHGHILNLGQAIQRLDLVGTRSAEEIAAKVKQHAAVTEKGRWI